MATVITSKKRATETLPKSVFTLLPPSLRIELEAAVRRGVTVDEIRIRADRRAYVTSKGKNIALDCVLDGRTVEEMVENICDGSLYAHADTIRKGYITLNGGVRVGLVGRAVLERGEVVGVYDINGLCIRIPSPIYGVGRCVCELFEHEDFYGGVLVYSPPGEGKTTLLRSVSAALASGESARRVVVVDTRGELGDFLLGERFSLDVLSGYPKALGIEIAARSMNAQLIVCDEIGDEAEVRAIIGAQNCGVPLLATAHARDICGLLRRTGIAALHRAAVFGAYVGIKRQSTEREFLYSVTKYREADELFKNCGGYNNSR